jgi:AcrR family transcriptional regulator
VAGSTAPGSAPAATARGRRRREAIVDAATALFDAHGFHATSMDDIGAAAGISGPGLYRHVGSKDDLLIAVLDRLWDRLRPAVDRAVEVEPTEALRGLVAAHARLAVEDPAALMLLVRELRNAPPDYQALARRNHQRYVDAWVAPLRTLHPELDGDGARVLAHAAHGLLDSAAINPHVGAAALRREQLEALALRLVLAP